MTNDCKTCPVSTGTHKPAEAVHVQIDEPQDEAMRLADECDESATHWVHEIDTRLKAAKMLRAQHARIAELEDATDIAIARIAELESQLEAIGAGGVEPLRKPAAAPQEEAIAEIVSASHDQAEFGERGINFLRDFQHLEYGTKLYPAAQAVHQIAEPAAPVGKPIKDAIDALVMAAFTEGGCSEHRMSEARIQTELRKKELCTLIAATQPAAQGMDEERLRNLLCKMVDQLERRGKHRDGNAPGHGHSIPGVWDSDNGELAGKKCAWCEVWQEALEVHAAAQAKQGG